jgi:hypothetical protein
MAIRATFSRRGTLLPVGLPVALTAEFADDRSKNAQWAAFCRKSGASSAGDLRAVTTAVSLFVALPFVDGHEKARTNGEGFDSPIERSSHPPVARSLA